MMNKCIICNSDISDVYCDRCGFDYIGFNNSEIDKIKIKKYKVIYNDYVNRLSELIDLKKEISNLDTKLEKLNSKLDTLKSKNELVIKNTKLEKKRIEIDSKIHNLKYKEQNTIFILKNNRRIFNKSNVFKISMNNSVITITNLNNCKEIPDVLFIIKDETAQKDIFAISSKRFKKNNNQYIYDFKSIVPKGKYSITPVINHVEGINNYTLEYNKNIYKTYFDK